MKIYRTEKHGIYIWRLSGVVEMKDSFRLIRSIKDSEQSNRGCMILDFESVDHVDYRVFEVLENQLPSEVEVLLSGLSDYLLDIFAFVRRKYVLPVYPDWKNALRYLLIERGKIATHASADFAGNK